MNTFDIKQQDGSVLKLPILNIKGKDYLQVAHRILWMRTEHKDWSIYTHAVQLTDTSALFKAKIMDNKGNILAEAHKFENKTGFPDFIEKAETGAVGRALAFCGYGTQFAHELDEGVRLADAPINPMTKSGFSNVPSPSTVKAPLVNQAPQKIQTKTTGNNNQDSWVDQYRDHGPRK